MLKNNLNLMMPQLSPLYWLVWNFLTIFLLWILAVKLYFNY